MSFQTNKKYNTPAAWTASALIIGACLGLTVYLWQSLLLPIPFAGLMDQIKNKSYFPHYNGFHVGMIAGSNMLQVYYNFLLTFLVVTLFVHGVLSIKKSTRPAASPLQIVTIIGLTGLILLAGIQQIRRGEAWDKEASTFGGKTTGQKNLIMFGELYAFSQVCRQKVSGRHQAELLTDLDIDQDPFMFAHRVLAYYLYPKLSIRFHNRRPKNFLILFYKKNPLSAIPADYMILTATEDKNYVLAGRKASLK